MTTSMAVSTMAAIQVPDDLTEYDQWVLWCRERGTKVPKSLKGGNASSTDPRTWAPFDVVLEAYQQRPGEYAGIGFVFAKQDPFVGIDLDDCLDDSGNLKPQFTGTVERFADSYMEASPSGRGIKIWCKGALPANLPKVQVQGGGGIEMYDHARYFTVTGQRFRGAALQVEDHAADVLHLYDSLTASKRKTWPLQPLQGGRIPHGSQHSTLVSIAGTLRVRRVCDEAILACLLAVNAHQCERPGTPEAISRIVRSTRTWGASA
jgi:hypothetical protein